MNECVTEERSGMGGRVTQEGRRGINRRKKRGEDRGKGRTESEIGRASCRERVSSSGVAVSVEKLQVEIK